MIRLLIIGACILFLLSGDVFATEREEDDKDLQILHLKRLLAEQTLQTLESEKKRIGDNLSRLIKQIEEYEAAKKEAKK